MRAGLKALKMAARKAVQKGVTTADSWAGL
jgi:hypothetical protein